MITMAEQLERLRSYEDEHLAEMADRIEEEYKNEGELKEEMLKDFVLDEKCSKEMIDKYEDRVPPFLLEIWEEYGLGTFKNGYLKVINPDDYLELLEEAYFTSEGALPILATAFGDIIIHEYDGNVSDSLYLLNYRKVDFELIPYGALLFYNCFQDKTVWKKKIDWKQYKPAVEKLGVPGYNECFCYRPLLCDKGAKKVENLQVGDIKTYIKDIVDITGPI